MAIAGDRGAETGASGGLIAFFRRLLGGASLLSLAGILQQGVGFLLLPVYTRYLSPSDYGQIEVLVVSVSLCLMVAGQGMPPSVLRHLSFVCGGDRERGKVAAGTGLLYVALAGGAFLALATLAAAPLGRLLFDAPGLGYLVVIGGAMVGLGAVTSVGSAVLLAAGRVSRAVAVGLAQFAVKLALNILLVVVLEVGFTGIIWSLLAGELVGVVLTLAIVRRHVTWRFDRGELRDLRAYGMPLVAASVGYQVLMVSDRYVLRLLRPAAELGLYAVANKFATAFYFVVLTPLARMWEINGLELAREEGGARRIARVANIYLVAGTLMCLGALIVIEPVLGWLVPAEFLGAESAIGILIGGSVLFGLAEIFKVGLRASGASRRIAVIAAAAAVLNLALTFALVPAWGFVGAAIATMISLGALAAAAAGAARGTLPVPWDAARLIWGGSLLMAVCLGQPLMAGLSPDQRLVLRAWLSLAYLVITPLLLDVETRKLLIDRLRRRRREALVEAEGRTHA